MFQILAVFRSAIVAVNRRFSRETCGPQHMGQSKSGALLTYRLRIYPIITKFIPATDL